MVSSFLATPLMSRARQFSGNHVDGSDVSRGHVLKVTSVVMTCIIVTVT